MTADAATLRTSRVRRIELVHSTGCPASADAQTLLRTILLERGVEAVLAVYEVRTQEEAEELRLLGSPTIRVDGRDVDPAGAESRPALNCRIYQLPDGGVSPVPMREQLEEALR